MRKTRYRSSSSSSGSNRREERKHRRRDSYSRRSRSKCECSRCHSRSRSSSHHRRVRFYGTRENPYKSRVLGVFGLSQTSNEAKLMQLFSPFGAVEHISLIYDAKTGNSRGFGFIYYSKIYEASEARKSMNGTSIDGRRIRVDFSITKRAHTPTPGVYMGNSKSKSDSDRSKHRSSSRSRSYSRSRSKSRLHSRRRNGKSTRRTRSYSR